MPDNLLGIDLGTGSVKALLLSSEGEGEILAEASQEYPVVAPHPGWAETEPTAWWQATAIAVRKVASSSHAPIQGIGLSGQMHGVVLTDGGGEPLRPAILWADRRSSATLAAYRELETGCRRSLGNPLAAGMAGPTLLWLREREPETYQEARWALQPKDWLRFRLTGEVATEPSDASGTLLYDVLADRWAFDALAALELRGDWLPEIIPSTAIAGQLTAAAAGHLGLLPGLPVVAGAADTAAGIVGNGLLELGTFQLTVGTGAQIITLHSQPAIDPHCRTHLFRSALPNQWYGLAAIQNAGLALEWVRQLLGLSWQEAYREAFAVPPGCEGVTFLPYLTGDRTPHLDPDARGAWVGLDLHHARGHLMRAAFEGVAFSLRQGLAALEAAGGKATELRLAGGGTLQREWQQLLADVLQVPLYSSRVADVSARGAAILAGMGMGIYQDMASVAQLTPPLVLAASPQPPVDSLEKAWQKYQTLYPLCNIGSS